MLIFREYAVMTHNEIPFITTSYIEAHPILPNRGKRGKREEPT